MAITIDLITAIIMSLMIIAIGIQIFSSNLQVSKIIPKVKILDSSIKYRLTKLSERDTRITRMDIHLNLLNESSSPVYIQFYKINIGNWDSRTYNRFPLKIKKEVYEMHDSEEKIEWKPYLFIPPNQMKSVHIVYDSTDHPMSCRYIKESIEYINKKKLKEIKKTKIELTGNFGIKKAKIEFYQTS